MMLKKVSIYFFLLVSLINVQSVQAALKVKHCITAPKRIYACDNLIYTSVKQSDKNKVICLCKTDRNSIISLLEKEDIATQRIMIRKFLSKHDLSKVELNNILDQIN